MEEQMIFEVTPELIETAREENPGVKLQQIELELDDGRIFQCIAKSPQNASIARYINSLGKAARQNKDAAQVHARFVYDNILFPNSEVLMEIIEIKELPLLPISIADELSEGSGLVASSKKKSL